MSNFLGRDKIKRNKRDNGQSLCITDFDVHPLVDISNSVATTLEHDLECHSELRVKERVEKWIDGGVEVSKPLQKRGRKSGNGD